MNTFISATTVNGKPIIINVEKVLAFTTDYDNDETKILTDTGRRYRIFTDTITAVDNVKDLAKEIKGEI